MGAAHETREAFCKADQGPSVAPILNAGMRTAVGCDGDMASDLDSKRPVTIDCTSCEATVFGGRKGARDFDVLAKAIKAHEDEVHAPYNATLRKALESAVTGANTRELNYPLLA